MINDINKIIRKLVFVDKTLYTKCIEKIRENKIKIDTDGNYTAYINDIGEIYFGKNFIKREDGEKLFIILHELLHEILEYIPQSTMKIKKGEKIINVRNLFNIAYDLTINSLLCKVIEEDIKIKTIVKIPEDATLPEYFNLPNEKSAEFYLIEILKNLDTILNNQLINFDKFDKYENESKNKDKNISENINENDEIIDMNNENIDINEIIEKISKKVIKNNTNNNSNKHWKKKGKLIKRIIENINR